VSNVQRVSLPDQVAEELALCQDANEMFDVLNAAADGKLTADMTLEDALRTIHQVAAGIEEMG
jgi:hypothetical protein